MNISNAQYYKDNDGEGDNIGIKFNMDDNNDIHYSVLLKSTGNIHLEEIQRQVEAGTLTIKDAD
tara:strand:- start:18 stop:209 length:192 start_codon:yes stop_codon:yes gene_type:complete